MTSLIVDRLRCLEEHDFFGEDDVYLVYFIGRNPPNKSTLHVAGPGQTWSDIGTGDVRETDVTLDTAYDERNLYLMALVEKDAGKDITGAERDNVEQWVKAAFTAYWASGSTPMDQLAFIVTFEMTRALVANFHGDDDNLLGTKWLKPLTSSGQWRSLNYYGDSSHYRVMFRRR